MLFATLAVWVGAGSFIYYNVSIQNKYRTGKQSQKIQAEYEKQYSQYAKVPQPKITDVKVQADVYPAERRTVCKGRFVIVNKSAAPIDSLHLQMSSPMYHTDMQQFSLDGKAP